eukprot:6491392-Amphidinium_carterae.4
MPWISRTIVQKLSGCVKEFEPKWQRIISQGWSSPLLYASRSANKRKALILFTLGQVLWTNKGSAHVVSPLQGDCALSQSH